MRLATIVAAALFTAGGLFAATSVQAAITHYELNIPREPLDTALKDLAQQTGLQVGRFSDAIKGDILVGPVIGNYSAAEALKTLLAPARLTYRSINDHAFIIMRPDDIPASPAPSPLSSTVGADERESFLDRPRVAQATLGNSVQTAPVKPPSDAGSPQEQPARLEEVIVTGSHIRGVRNDTSPMVTLDQTYIQRSGFTTMSQLVQSLTMNFNGGDAGASETAAFGNSPYAGQNLNRGTGFNLHGMGSVATLTLIDGRRVAPAAEGQFVDISNIPLAAVERVEILTDGASAIYGADAVAGVVNIILRKNFDGAETVLESGIATRGNAAEERISQTLGKTWSSGNALLVADFYKRDPLDARDRDFIVEAGGAQPLGPTYLLPKRNAKTLILNLNQSLPEGFDLTGNVLYSHEQVRQATTDVTGELDTNSPVTNQWSAMLGLGYQAIGDWRLELDGNISQMKTVTDFTGVDLPTQTLVFLIDNYRDKFDMWTVDFKADGSLFELPAGKARLAIGGSYRRDQAHSDREWVIPARGYQLHADDSRDVRAVFLELFVPLVSRAQQIPWVRRIDLSLAGRYDDYSDFGNTTNPKFGLVWTPVDGLDIRASYGRSFRAPTVYEKALVNRGVQISNTTVDGLDGSQVPIFFLAGSKALTAERSRDFSLGLTYRPERAPGAELAVNYFNVDYTGRISTPPFDNGMLFNRSEFGSLITELPSDAAAQAYLDSAVASGALYQDLLGTGATGVRYVFDWRQQNAARSKIDGVDVTGAYQFVHGIDTYALNLSYTRLDKIRTSLLADTTPVDLVNTYEQPLKNRARLMGTWSRGGFSSTPVVNYTNSYINASVLPREPVKALTTVDLTLAYDFSQLRTSGVLSGTKVSFSVRNLFDVNPPHANDPLYSMGFDVFNADAIGRYVTLRLANHW